MMHSNFPGGRNSAQTDTMIKIAEIYNSIQGEGFFTGTPSVFVRTSGCNLRCHFCDSPFTSWEPEGISMEIPAIMDRVLAFDARHVVVTGGEPMLTPQISELTRKLTAAQKLVTVETAGTIWQEVACELMSISPKLSNSTPPKASFATWHDRHEARREQPSVLKQLIAHYPYQIKFVVAQPEDITEIEDFLRRYSSIRRDRVLLMPEGIDRPRLEEVTRWLEPLCQERELHFCPRKHIEWFGHTRGT